MKKWAIGVISTVVIVPTLVFGWNRVQRVWAAPSDIRIVDEKVDALAETQREQSKILAGVVELQKDMQYRQDKSEAVTNLQISTLKDIVKEIKRK